MVDLYIVVVVEYLLFGFVDIVDYKFVVGICLEPFLALLVIIIASMIALPISLVLLVKEKEHAIPFGPFILIGNLIVFLTKFDSMKIVNFLLGK